MNSHPLSQSQDLMSRQAALAGLELLERVFLDYNCSVPAPALLRQLK
jgi:hypothetical protein